ncbi:hypothetical protein [uncultured Desulfuromonas sp.]|uniref:hypothetical protein n=1 Tax=uncultured Desulfuromonas sp. TaxID=181013 RepID=UPI00374D8BF7
MTEHFANKFAPQVVTPMTKLSVLDTVLLNASISSAFNTNSTAVRTGMVINW